MNNINNIIPNKLSELDRSSPADVAKFPEGEVPMDIEKCVQQVGKLAGFKPNNKISTPLHSRAEENSSPYLNFDAIIPSVKRAIPQQIAIANAFTVPAEPKAETSPPTRTIGLKQKAVKFVSSPCPPNTLKELLPKFQNEINNTQDFNIAPFLSGVPTGPEVEINDNILNSAKAFIQNEAKSLVQDGKVKDSEAAYKALIEVINRCDQQSIKDYEKDHSLKPPSSFALRSAVLIASQEDGVSGIQSFMVYTRGLIPERNGAPDIWRFLDDWKNFVPEAQGAMAKFVEATLIKVRDLALKNSKNLAILVKGGYGAGKTHFLNKMLENETSGVLAPDKGKQVVRKTMREISHATAHIQGSQLAFKMFDEMLEKVIGTVVYDSSLSEPQDISNYLDKSRQAGKKMVIYDVVRNDMARALAVLKREVEGEDPRIPPEFIIQSAINDKLKRVECMKVILSANFSEEEKEIIPEYPFIASDEKGWNSTEVLLLTPEKMKEVDPRMKERLALEGIEIDIEKDQLELKVDRKTLESYFDQQFERTTREIMTELSPEENESFEAVFGRRVLLSKPAEGLHNPEELYRALSENIQQAISLEGFKTAFQSIKPELQTAFFESIQQKSSISYLDLPLRTALKIHQQLKFNPF